MRLPNAVMLNADVGPMFRRSLQTPHNLISTLNANNRVSFRFNLKNQTNNDEPFKQRRHVVSWWLLTAGGNIYEDILSWSNYAATGLAKRTSSHRHRNDIPGYIFESSLSSKPHDLADLGMKEQTNIIPGMIQEEETVETLELG